MEAKIYIEELQEEVTFTSKLLEVDGRSVESYKRAPWLMPVTLKNASLTLDEIHYEDDQYSDEEKIIIDTYLDCAEIALFEEARSEYEEV